MKSIFFPICIEHFTNAAVKSLTFSSTQTLGQMESQILTEFNRTHEELIKKLEYEPFPPNNSSTTKKELENLYEKENNRSPERELDINKQLFIIPYIKQWPGLTSKDLVNIERFLSITLNPIIIKIKTQYNRVRPSFLSPGLNPSIKVPEHPSYPSGHSTQIFTIAFFAAEKYPFFANEYREKAEEYATNREFAGVHYKSDTIFGEKNSKIYFQEFRKPIDLIENYSVDTAAPSCEGSFSLIVPSAMKMFLLFT